VAALLTQCAAAGNAVAQAGAAGRCRRLLLATKVGEVDSATVVVIALYDRRSVCVVRSVGCLFLQWLWLLLPVSGVAGTAMDFRSDAVAA
jgi:hypothetical protein